MNDPYRSSLQLRSHDRGVVRVKDIFAKPVSRGLREGLQCAVNPLHIACGEGGEIDDMDTDVAEDAFAAVFLREPPEESRCLAPVSPSFDASQLWR